MSFWEYKTVVVTGGTGSFGRAFTARILKEKIRALRILSRDELKQSEMRADFPDERVRFFIGDVRDRDRLRRAFDGADIVIHAAALKQIVAAEYNPIEAIKTNVMGTANVIEAALDANVGRVMALSTDKACSPLNLYGATKAVLERLVVQANSYSGSAQTHFAVVRYGNVVGSRGSVVPLFQAQHARGEPLTITHPEMTRFWITLEQAVEWIKERIEEMSGGELYVPKIPSIHILDLVEAISGKRSGQEIGIRPGEKLHETLISKEESRRAFEHRTHYTLAPEAPMWQLGFEHWLKPQPEFVYSSDANEIFLSPKQIRAAL